VPGYFFVWKPDVKKPFGNKTPAPKPGSAAAWIDELLSADELRLMTGKQVHEAIWKKAEARGLTKWPGLRAVQSELTTRRKQT
jgi:hypothetical protein